MLRARAALLLLAALAAACGGGETRTLRLAVRSTDGTPLVGAEVLYLQALWERPYGGIAVPPLDSARALADARAVTDAEGFARLEVARDGSGGLLALADGHAPGGFLVADELPRAGRAAALTLRPGRIEQVRVVAPRESLPGGEQTPQSGPRSVVPVSDLVLTTWFYNTASVEHGHDLQLYAEEVASGVYAFPALQVVPTLWNDGRSWDVARVTPIGWSENGAVRGEDGVFVAELADPPAPLRVRYRGGEGLPERLLLEVQPAAAPADEAAPVNGSEDWEQWYVFGAPLAAGGTLDRAVALAEEVRSLVFFVHAEGYGSLRFALPAEGLRRGGPVVEVDVTDALRTALTDSP